MTLQSFATGLGRSRASTIFVAHFRTHVNGGSSHPRPFPNPEVTQNPNPWFVKVVCTLFLGSHLSPPCLDYLRNKLSPSVALEVVKRLNNPKLGFEFFELCRVSLGVNHSFWTYNFLIRSLCQMGLHDSAKMVFDGMRSAGMSPDGLLVGFLVSCFARVGKFDLATKFIADAHCDQVGVSCVVYNNILNMLVRDNRVEEAVRWFNEHLVLYFRPDAFTFTILVRGLCRIGEVDKAFDVVNDMRRFGCFPNVVTYNTLINGLCRVGQVDRGYELLKEVQSRGEVSPNVVTYTSVILGYCRSGNMEAASIVLDEMVGYRTDPNVFTFNVLIDGFVKAGDMASVLAMYQKMLFVGCAPDVVTFTSLIDGYCRDGQLNQGLKLWGEMKAKNVSPSVYTYAILVNALCKENRLNEACDFLRELNRSDIIPKPFIYNPVIDGFCKCGNVDEANVIVEEMVKKRCNPDKVTFTILIIGHCMKRRMPEAISLFYKMLATSCAPDAITVRSLVSCLLKAGMPKEAHRIVQTVSQDSNLGCLLFKKSATLK